MPRLSSPIADESRSALLIEEGYPVVVVNRAGGTDLRVRSLKRLNRTAYDAHLCQMEIGGEKVRINVEDLKRALRYV